MNFNASSGKSEDLNFDVLLLSKVYYVWVKRGAMCHKTEEWCKIWGGIDLRFEKWHEEFGEFWPNTRNSQNLHFNGVLLTKVYNVWANKLEELRVMTVTGDAIFKEKMTGSLKNDIRNLANFHSSSRKSENLHFDGLVLSTAYKVSDAKEQMSYVSWQRKSDSKKSKLLRKAHSWIICFFCDAIDLKQSVEGTLKV